MDFIAQCQSRGLFFFLPVFRIHDIFAWIRIRGSMPLTNGSGSCYFRHWPSRCQPKTNFLTQFFLLVTSLHYFSKIKSQKESQNGRIQDFSYYFCVMIEGSGGPKNMWIRWIRIRWNTAFFYAFQTGDKTRPIVVFMCLSWADDYGSGSRSDQRFEEILTTYFCQSPQRCSGTVHFWPDP